MRGCTDHHSRSLLSDKVFTDRNLGVTSARNQGEAQDIILIFDAALPFSEALLQPRDSSFFGDIFNVLYADNVRGAGSEALREVSGRCSAKSRRAPRG